MATAKIKFKNGTHVVVKGTPEEVTAVIVKLKGENKWAGNKPELSARRRDKTSVTSPTDLLISLVDGDFFKLPRDLASIKHGLEELGYKYPVTSLSPLARRLVRKRILRRFKEDKRWMYTIN